MSLRVLHAARFAIHRAFIARGGSHEPHTAASLGQEADHAVISAWSQELTCWFALTQGRHRQVIEAARVGREMAPDASVAVQLAGQEAKAWARMGDRRQVELALERGRLLLESLPYPDNLDNHFTVDPDKFDFYAMDCYRRTGEDAMATMQADEVIRKSTATDGSFRAPMRVAEARTTLAVAAARGGDLDGAVELGASALDSPANRSRRCSWSPETSWSSYDATTTESQRPSTTSTASTPWPTTTTPDPNAGQSSPATLLTGVT